jgi:hypothetical protein
MDANNDHAELARRLCAAVVSVRLGVSVETALRRYVPAQPGHGWMQLAASLQQEYAQAAGKLFRPPGSTPRDSLPTLPLQNPRSKPS